MKLRNYLVLISILGLQFMVMTSKVSAGVIAHYSFDDHLNDSATANSATAFGNISFVTGVSGSAVNLDNGPTNSFFYINEYLQLQDIDYGSEFSVAHWVRFDSNAHLGGHVAATISAGRDGTGNTFRTQVTQNGTISASISSNGSNGDTTFSNINDGQFHHIGIAVNQTSISIYLDGLLANTSALSGGATSMGLQNTFVGLHRWIDGGNRQSSRFDGAIDELYIFDEALSAAQFQELAGVSVSEPGQLGLLIMALIAITRRRKIGVEPTDKVTG